MAEIVPKTTSLDRAIKRERERKARERRAMKFEQMQSTLEALECAALVVHTLGDCDAVWDDFLDDDGKRMRRYLTQSLELTKEAASLHVQNRQLHRLVREHELSMRVISGMVRERERLDTDDWDWRVSYLRDVAHSSFKPWTFSECRDGMDAAFRQVEAFQWSADKQTSGVSFLGWRESRRVDPIRGLFHFQFYKTFRGYDMQDYVDVGWRAYTDSKTFLNVILGPRVRGSHEVLQRIDENTVIVRGAQRFPHLSVDVHIVYLVFRIQTEHGVTQCVRSILCPELQNAIDSPKDMWASNFLWFKWEQQEDDDRSYMLKIGGAVGGKDVTYLNQWMLEALGCILRSETMATGRQLLTNA